MKVGFIGLGRMGREIALRLLAADHELAVYNRTPEKAADIAAAGATVADTMAAACAGREVVITMLSDDRALDSVLRADDGLLAGLEAGAIHMAMGTHSVDAMRAVTAAHAAAGQVFVASPVMGRPEAVIAGQLGMIPAGPVDAVATCGPLFEAIGRRTFDGGVEPAGAASVKIAMNYVVGCAIEVMGEAFSLIRKFGVEPQVFYETMTDTLFDCPAYKVYGDIIAKEDYERIGFTAALGLKDCNLAMAAGNAVSVPLPSGNVWRDRLLSAHAHGESELDWAVVARAQARASGLE